LAFDGLAPKPPADMGSSIDAADQAGTPGAGLEVLSEPPLDIHIVTAGYDAGQLQAIILALSQACGMSYVY
jgi:hypothetical protein